MLGVNERKKRDIRVEQALDEIELKYQLSDGLYGVGFNLPEGRSHMGFIHSQTSFFAGVEMREIFSVGLRSNGLFDQRTANILLGENANVKIGSWCITKDDDGICLAIFRVPVAADLPAELLKETLNAVIWTADMMEERYSGMDEF